MNKVKFNGYLGQKMQEHLNLRRALGRDYRANEGTLQRFNKLIQKCWPNKKTVTREMVMAFLRTNLHIKTISRKNELTYIRMFCMDLAAQGVPVYLPERRLLPKSNESTRVHIFKESELLKIMRSAELLRKPEVRLAYATLVGFFWSTGLRLQEALWANIGDIDWKQRLFFVRRGKYGKSRWVPLSRSTLEALDDHVRKMRKLGIKTENRDPLFVGSSHERLTKSSATHCLHDLYRAAGIKTAWGGYPRTVDLRHTFATNALKGVQKNGRDPGNKVPALAVVMGHASLGSTQVYLHPSMETLQVASKAFEKKLLSFKEAA